MRLQLGEHGHSGLCHTPHRGGMSSQDYRTDGDRSCAREAARRQSELEKRIRNPATTVAVPSEGRTDATKRARQDELETPQESATTGRASNSSAGADVDMRVIHAGKRPLDPGGDKDMVCGLDVCDDIDELDENSFSDTYVKDREGHYTDEVTGETIWPKHEWKR